MLDVEGGPHVDPGVEQLAGVLPALGVAEPGALVCASSSSRSSAGRGGPAGAEVELPQIRPRYSAARRYPLQAFEERRGPRRPCV